MKSPKEMKIIQIELTNACSHKCANCTRFCGHHKKPFFMDMETCKKAVDSMEGFQGMVGIMGGEPTLHPKFREIIDYYAKKIPLRQAPKKYLRPSTSFIEHRNQFLSDTYHSRGLWSSLGAKYYEHFELIQDTFPYQCINDHQNPGLHQALLITRKELGIPDAEWIQLRDQCWVQNLWSASISPKGAFFCEIAAALDMLFDGPGGWPIEKGWWKRTPDEFCDQLEWCELCSAALPVPRNQANTGIDIISPVLKQLLEAVGSPKIRRGRYQLFSSENYTLEDYQRNINDPEWYLPSGDNKARIEPTNNSIFPKKMNALSLEGAHLCSSIPILKKNDFNKGNFSGWCVIHQIDLSEGFFNEMRSTVLNPGCLYYFTKKKNSPVTKADVIIFSRNALSLDGVNSFELSPGFFSKWDQEKIIPLYHFPHFGEMETILTKIIKSLERIRILRVFRKFERRLHFRSYTHSA